MEDLSVVFLQIHGPNWNVFIFMAILYTIYLVFKHGVKLQEDSNTVI